MEEMEVVSKPFHTKTKTGSLESDSSVEIDSSTSHSPTTDDTVSILETPGQLARVLAKLV